MARSTVLVETAALQLDWHEQDHAPRVTRPTRHSVESMVRATADLFHYLYSEIFPQLAPPPYGAIEIEKLSNNKPVYLITEQTKNVAVVAKIFRYSFRALAEAWQSAGKEYRNLSLLRKRFGMDCGPYQVVAPLGKKKELSALLVTEKAPGRMLDYYIAEAIFEHHSDLLFGALASLARFLLKLHRNSQDDRPVPADLPQRYLSGLYEDLGGWLLTPDDRDAIEGYAARWWDEDDLFSTDREVIVHGDATPTNFLFNGDQVTAIDLERMKWADRCWDLGFVAAELKHHFMWRAGDKWAAEPFIGHFLWEYAANYEGERFFHALTSKIPLYMALGLLRIARNTWLDEPYRRELIAEARRCLEYGL
jgi:aminoglycoside phosphotransferase (APT) family kinase protein